MNLFLVRPHPPTAILTQSCPIPEAYKYNWQPTVLKYIAYYLKKAFGDNLNINIWHLMNKDDDEKFKEALLSQEPDIVVFSEIDILVNEVNKLALYVKKALPQTWTIVGGKHTSLLREGDLFPFQAIDFAIRGDGIKPIQKIVSARMEGYFPSNCPGVVKVDSHGKVNGPESYEQRTDITALDGIMLQSLCIENHPFEEYLEKHQIHPAIVTGQIRTASLFAGSGCPYKCVFCQSPVEYGRESSLVKNRPPEKIAEEIAWLVNNHKVNNIFSLEANLNLRNLVKTYECLEKYGITYLPVSGFIRADDIVEAHRDGILGNLTQKGMRVLSVGLDIPFDMKEDIYRKAFSHEVLLECLTVCENLGIILLGTFVGDPGYTFDEMKKQLQYLKEIPVAAVDIRLSIALRNTEYYRQVFPWLIYNPDENHQYFNRQNYRYQTIKIPGKITPKKTYSLVRSFHRHFLTDDKHLEYVLRFIRRYPESLSFFSSQYAPVIKNSEKLTGKLKELADLMA